MSPTLEPFLARHGDALRAAVAVVSDTELAGPRPAIVYGLRGALAFELALAGARGELHSGRFGGAVLDPIQSLCAFVARMHDREGRIVIPGFFSGVRSVPWAERLLLRAANPDAALLSGLGAPPAQPHDGFSVTELATIRPAITLHGIAGGYAGQGWKAVVPTAASVRGSARLVPDQDPRRVAAALTAFTRATLPRPLRWRLRFARGTRGVRMSTADPALRAAAQAVRDVWGAPPPFAISGGTIPAVEALHRRLGIPVIVLGFGKADDRIHAADERFDLPTFFCGVDTMIRLLAELAR
jgi:acetylornithine deacetylase/succinyl-diaminopimelate desuccinylase-like protein